MLPQNTLSTEPYPNEFLLPRNRFRARLVDYDHGGIALNDPSQGLRVKIWRCRWELGDFIVDAPDVASTVIHSASSVYELGFTFDQNMQWFLVWVTNIGEAFYRWFDPTVPGLVTVPLDLGTITPRCALDDKREVAGTEAGASDIILTYMREDALYYRQQRERFLTERELASGVITVRGTEYDLADQQLYNVGMNRFLRFQWRFARRQPQPGRPVPTLVAIDPSVVALGSDGFMLEVFGTGFFADSVVRLDDVDLDTTFVSGEELAAAVPPEALEDIAIRAVRVFTPTPGGGLSDALPLMIVVGNPVPVITSIDPDEIEEGGESFTLTVTGTGFIEDSEVELDGEPLSATYISSTELEATVPDTAITAPATIEVTVVSPGPGGGTSGVLTLTVTAAPEPDENLWFEIDAEWALVPTTHVLQEFPFSSIAPTWAEIEYV
jgi:hypothetical protein